MRVVFATNNAYLPDATTGLVISTDILARGLLDRNHEAMVLAGVQRTGPPGWPTRIAVSLSRRKCISDRRCGYTVTRAWFPWDEVETTVSEFRPDMAVVQGKDMVRLAKAFLRAKIRTIVYIRDVEFEDFGGDVGEIASCGFIANSQFTADTFRQKFQVQPKVIRPTIFPERYRVSSSRENITFINPDKKKGVDLAYKIAEACPNIPFSFVESWALSRSSRKEIKSRIRSLPNVSYRPRVSDVRRVYAKAKIVLAPSLWEEAWGRVASEAHVSGIPVIGSRRGGLPEAVGPGGILINHDGPLSQWVDAVRALWNDETLYRSYSEAALVYSQRSELNPELQIQEFIETLRDQLHLGALG